MFINTKLIFLNNFSFDKNNIDEKQLAKLKQRLLAYIKETSFSENKGFKEFGRVISNENGIVLVSGLALIKAGELVEFETKELGLVLNLHKDYIKVTVLGNGYDILVGQTVVSLNKLVGQTISHDFLGRVIDPLGNFLDTNPNSEKSKIVSYKKVDIKAAGLNTRYRVSESVSTGLLVIDSMIPIGRGQRELIIGDRQTGKTTIALDTIIAQSKIYSDEGFNLFSGLFCIYVSIGQRQAMVANIVKTLQQHNALFYSIIVAATASTPASLQYLAPYVGCSIGEFFRDHSSHALIVYDDLSKQAVAYRQLSLLLRRAPGREAYPGDIFYLHSRLLERSAKLNEKYGFGSLTALPIIETQAGDITAYIPTNVISITDGQIFLENELFYQGIRPAVNTVLSVSRVGASAQFKCMKQVAGSLKLELAQYRALEAFTSLGSDLDVYTLKILSRGAKLIELLKQKPFEPLLVHIQIILIYAGTHGFFDDVNLDRLADFKFQVINDLKDNTNLMSYNLNNDLPVTEIEEFLTNQLIKFNKN